MKGCNLHHKRRKTSSEHNTQTRFLLLLPWPWPTDLDRWMWPRYTERCKLVQHTKSELSRSTFKI